MLRTPAFAQLSRPTRRETRDLTDRLSPRNRSHSAHFVIWEKDR